MYTSIIRPFFICQAGWRVGVVIGDTATLTHLYFDTQSLLVEGNFAFCASLPHLPAGLL